MLKVMFLQFRKRACWWKLGLQCIFKKGCLFTKCDREECVVRSQFGKIVEGLCLLGLY